MVHCPYCGAENYIGGKYCKNCFGPIRQLSKQELERLTKKSAHPQLRDKLIRYPSKSNKGFIFN